MAAITAAMVKELRESTGAGMMECKKALTETDGDMEAAVDVLRKSGAAKVEKKAGRIAAEGITRVASEGNTAVVVEVNSETDFVAKNAVFQEFVQNVADKALKASVDKAGDGEDVCAILDMKSELEEKTIVIGEKLSLRRFEKLTGDCVASYVHGGGRIGVLVAAEGALLIRILFHIFTNLTLCGHLVVQISQQIGVCLVFQDFAVFRDLYSYQHIDHRDHNKGCCNRYADLDDQIHNRTTEGLLNTGQIGFIDAYHQIPGCVRNGKMTENLTYAVLIDMQYPIVALLLLSVKQCPASKTLCYPF